MQSRKRADLIGHIKFLPWEQLDGCSVTRPFLSAKGVACETTEALRIGLNVNLCCYSNVQVWHLFYAGLDVWYYLQHKIPYSGKLFEGENFANWWKIQFLRRKFHELLAFAAPKDAMPPNFTEKTSRIVTKTQNSRKFSPSKVSCYMVDIDEWG